VSWPNEIEVSLDSFCCSIKFKDVSLANEPRTSDLGDCS